MLDGDSAGVLEIAIRLPNGQREMRRFRSSDALASVLNYLAWKGHDVVGCVLVRAYPRTQLADISASLQSTGVHNMEMLSVERT